MIQLPKVQTLKPKSQPHNFFIWGATMSGKSYFSSFFPNPLILNTDGNSEQGSAPSIQIRNIRNSQGKLEQSAIKQLDDICVMIEQAICLDAGVQALSDIPYGKGYAMFNTALQQFVMDLKALPLNVIYISRELAITDENTGATTYEPSLKAKYYNIVNGNCDVVIRTKKIGDGQNASYFREVKALRTMYNPANITDHRILQLLKSCTGMFKKEDLEKLQAKKKENK